MNDKRWNAISQTWEKPDGTRGDSFSFLVDVNAGKTLAMFANGIDREDMMLITHAPYMRVMIETLLEREKNLSESGRSLAAELLRLMDRTPEQIRQEHGEEPN